MSSFHRYSLDKRVVPTAQALAMLNLFRSKGFSSEQILRHTGLTEVLLNDSEERISYRQRIQQLQNVIELTDNPGFWLDWPSEVSISDYGLLGYAMMSSATLEKAIQIAARYHKMAGAMFELTFVIDEDDAVLRIDHLLATGIVGQFIVEELFRGITPLIRLLLGGPFRPSEVRLNYPAPAYIARYEKAFDCQVKFNQMWCEYRFDGRLLARPLAEADPNTARICEESCRKLLDQMEIEEDLVSRICHQLLSKPGDFPKLAAVAVSLSVGERTLRRRLKDLGTSYQKILDDVKKELAIEYLQTTNLSIQEISDLLGYSEVTNFRRAFVKWVQMSPHQYRKHLN
ncbi:MAG: AraC family transcriptional regulator [Gammaproteobacteria bacterium]|nr:AraC family transcriptional regulator [Gammaproteobacteria bacterium]